MAETKGKYPCKYCTKPCLNPQSREMHERACPQNPDRHISEKGKKDGTEVLFPRGNSYPSSEEQSEEANVSEEKTEEIEDADQTLKKLPTISSLVEDVTSQRKSIIVLNAKLATILTTLGKLNNYLSQNQGNPSSPPPETESKPKPRGINVQAALDASLAADKGVRSDQPEASTSKMEELRREAQDQNTEQIAKQDGSGTEQERALAAMGQSGLVPEGMQKVMAYATMAKEFLPILQALKGQPLEQAQTPDDMKALDRTFANMSQLFTLALKMTDNVTREARKRVIDEITSTYSLVPRPGSGISIPGVQAEPSSQKHILEEPQGKESTEEAE